MVVLTKEPEEERGGHSSVYLRQGRCTVEALSSLWHAMLMYVDYKHNVLESSDPERPGSKHSSFPSCLLRLLGVTCLSPTCVAPCSSVDRTFNATYCSNLRNDRQTMDYRLDSQ